MKRVEIKNSKDFFNEILKDQSLKSLSKKINVNYSTLKKWRRGEYLIPKRQFDKLIRYANNKKYWLDSINLKDENWGRSKGGKRTVSQLSQEELHKKLKKARSKIKALKPKDMELVINKNLCEFYGILMGDGCLSKFKREEGRISKKVIISGHKKLDKRYHEDYIKNLVQKEFSLNSYIYCSKKKNARSLIITSKPFFDALEKLGFPIGKKGQKLKIPEKIIKEPWDLKKYTIRGIFDTDGCITARKDEGYKYPHIILSTNSKPLLKQLYNSLRRKGYPFWVSKSRSEIKMKGIKNTIKWMKDIGSSNHRHKFKYEYWLKNKKLPSNLKGP